MILVDAIKKTSPSDEIPLSWVGMQNVNLPVPFLVGEKNLVLNCEFDIFVDLIKPSKGIHMSRLYDLLESFIQKNVISFSSATELLSKIVDSQNGLSSRAKLALKFSLPMEFTTLKSARNYLKSVPVEIIFSTKENPRVKMVADYSSTCPQSAALAHQLTIQELKNVGLNTANELIEWMGQRGFIATPHAQRSQLTVDLVVSRDFNFSDLHSFYKKLLDFIGTSTQGLVKREDEQEFARLNANNLMFCEDAARKVILFLKNSPLVVSAEGHVSHFESLHSHNAVAHFNFKSDSEQ